LKILPFADDTVVYKLTDAQAKKYTFYDFGVTPSGTVWALIDEMGSPELEAVEFRSKGEAKTPIHLDLPENVQATRFLALDSGVLLVAGNYTDKAPESKRRKSFLGIFNDSGGLLRDLRDNIPASNLVKAPGGELREGACTAGDDGNAYFLGKDSIVSITAGGEIGKPVHFSKPIPDLVAAGLYISRGWAAIRFHKNNINQTVEKSFLVIELATGETMGWYKPPAGYNDVGFSANEGFTFFGNDHGKMKLVQAKLR